MVYVDLNSVKAIFSIVFVCFVHGQNNRWKAEVYLAELWNKILFTLAYRI